MRTLSCLLTLGVVFLMQPVGAAELPATLTWSDRTTLSTPVSGVVREVTVGVGDRVAKGALLVRLDDRGFSAALAEARAGLVQATESRKEAEREWERAQEFYDRTLLSQHELQMARITHATALADYQASRGALTRAELELEYSALRAPFEAIVLRRHVQAGETVVTRLEAVPLLELAAADRMVALASIGLDQLAGIDFGDTVRVRVAGREYRGRVTNAGLEMNGGGYPLEVTFETGGERLRAGQAATIVLR